MDFIWENQDRRLQGVDVQTIQAASSEEILKEFRQRHALFAVCFQPTMETAPADAPTKVTQQSMQRVLKEYEDVFQEPSSLPPAREVDHCITIKEGTEPINVRPYRYAHFQKAEIEKQVQEMLDSGLIRPSTSPFSSSVLLVKKKMAVGDFVQTTVHLTSPPSRIVFPFRQWMMCWKNYMAPLTSPNLI